MQLPQVLGQILIAIFGYDEKVLNPDAAYSLPIQARFDCEGVAGFELDALLGEK